MSRVAVMALTLAVIGSWAPVSARAWCQMTTSRTAPTDAMPCVTDGVPLSWRTGCMAYSVDERGGIDVTADQLEGAVDRGFAAWLGVTCGGLRTGLDARGYSARATCQNAEYRTGRGNVNVVAMVDDWDQRPNYDPEAFAVTTVWHNRSTGEIYDVDILVNEQLGPYAICAGTGCPPGLPRNRVVDVENVLTHEIGHFFGIAHSDVPNATMYVFAGRGEIIKRSLEADDEEALCTIYPPGALAACTDHTPRGGLDLNCEDDPVGSSCAVSGQRAGTGGGAAGLVLLLGVVLPWRRSRRSRAKRGARREPR